MNRMAAKSCDSEFRQRLTTTFPDELVSSISGPPEPRSTRCSKKVLRSRLNVLSEVTSKGWSMRPLSTVTTRLERIGDRTSGVLDTTSMNLRVIFPYVTLVNVWSRWPLFGVGIGGKEVILDRMFSGVDNPLLAIGTSATAEFGTFLGLLGGAWFIWLLLMQASQTGAQRLGLMLVIGALLSQLQGGMESFRYWGFIALLWGALAVADTQANGDGGLPRE